MKESEREMYCMGYREGYERAKTNFEDNMTDRQMVNKAELDKALYERFHDEDSVNNITVVALGEVRKFIQDYRPSESEDKE